MKVRAISTVCGASPIGDGRVPSDAWKKPEPAFPVDDELARLLRSGRLRHDFAGDPFLTLRCYLARGVTIGRARVERQNEARRQRRALRAAQKDLRVVEKQLQVVFSCPALVTPISKGGDPYDPRAELAWRARIDGVMAGVHALEAGLIGRAEKVGQASDDVFRPALIEELAYGWVRLFAKVPGAEDADFVALVQQAHATVVEASAADLDLPFHLESWNCDEERVRNLSFQDRWDWQAKKTMTRLSGRADRFEQGSAPPSVGVQPSAARRRPGATRREFNEETARLIEQMRAGGEHGRDAAQILWCECDLARREVRDQYIRELHFNPADAVALIWPGHYWSIAPLGS